LHRGIIPAPYSKLNNYLAGYVPPGLLINRSAFGNTGIERLAMKKIPEHLFIARNHNLDIRRQISRLTQAGVIPRPPSIIREKVVTQMAPKSKPEIHQNITYQK
jgi:hypothetical protein